MPEIPVTIEGKNLYIEVEPQYGSEATSAHGTPTARIDQAFENAKESIIAVCQSMVDTVRKVDTAVTPDEFSLEFGIKFKADGTILLASVSTEASLTVRMTYKHKEG
jgi:Trypsin-co-occurring domain 1